MLPELAEPEPAAARTRRSTARAPRAAASLDGEWEFRLAARPEDAPARTRTTTRLERGRRAGSLDDAGLRRRRSYTNVADAVRRSAAERAGAERDGHLPAHASRVPRGWRRRPVVLHFGGVRGRALRARQRRAGRASPRTRALRRSSTSRELVHHDRAERAASPSSSAGRTRASSRTRTSGGTRASRARSALVLADASRDLDVRATLDDDLGTAASRSTPSRRRRAAARRARPRRRQGRARRRPLRGGRSRAAALVGRAADALHARAERGRRDGLVPRRLPARRGARPAAARQRRARAASAASTGTSTTTRAAARSRASRWRRTSG